jgi:hypothetical protein
MKLAGLCRGRNSLNEESHLEGAILSARPPVLRPRGTRSARQGKLGGKTVLKPRMTLGIPEIGFEHLIEGEIGVG